MYERVCAYVLWSNQPVEHGPRSWRLTSGTSMHVNVFLLVKTLPEVTPQHNRSSPGSEYDMHMHADCVTGRSHLRTVCGWRKAWLFNMKVCVLDEGCYGLAKLSRRAGKCEETGKLCKNPVLMREHLTMGVWGRVVELCNLIDEHALSLTKPLDVDSNIIDIRAENCLPKWRRP